MYKNDIQNLIELVNSEKSQNMKHENALAEELYFPLWNRVYKTREDTVVLLLRHYNSK